ncbi:MAG: sulfite exporter TauE/SafE family protein [Steroidobacteraceae bacterium]
MDLSTLWPVALAMLGTALFSGVVAGLLGVGGGIVIVPALEYALQFTGVPPQWRMHVAVATSLATIIPTSISSARAHHARGAVDFALVKSWGPGMLLGALAGSLLASRVDARADRDLRGGCAGRRGEDAAAARSPAARSKVLDRARHGHRRGHRRGVGDDGHRWRHGIGAGDDAARRTDPPRRRHRRAVRR